MTVHEVSAFLLGVRFSINKTELENIESHFGGDDGIDLASFLAALTEDERPVGTTFGVEAPASPHKSHLALSGVSHVEFGQQYKTFPAHWGKPPNAQVKGFEGSVRELPDGYGKGNAPMAKWVERNLEKDTRSGVTGGYNPHPYGNYSYGCSPTL